jgi:hypothetical protein
MALEFEGAVPLEPNRLDGASFLALFEGLVYSLLQMVKGHILFFLFLLESSFWLLTGLFPDLLLE